MRATGRMLVLATVLAAGCGDDREPMWIDLEMLIRSIDDMRRDMRDHASAVAVAMESADVRTVERGYGHEARAHIDEMAKRAADMGRLCERPDGRRPEVARIIEMVESLRADLASHGTVMGAGILERDRIEEGRYQSVTDGKLEELRTEAEILGAAAGGYWCTLHN